MGFEEKYTDSDKKTRYIINDIENSGLSQDTLIKSLQDKSLEDVLSWIKQDGSDGTLPTIDDLNSCRVILERCKTEERDNKTPSKSTSKARQEANLIGLNETIHHINERIKVRKVLDAREKLVEPPPYSNDTIPNALVEQWNDYKQKIKAFNADLQAILNGKDFKTENFLELNQYIESLFKTEPKKSAELMVFEQMLVAFNNAKDNPKESAINLIVLNIEGMCEQYPKECNRQTMIRTLGDNLNAYEGYIEKLFGKTSTEKSEAVPAPPVSPPVSPGTPPSAPRRSSRLTRINTTKITKIMREALSLATSASTGRFTTKKEIKKRAVRPK